MARFFDLFLISSLQLVAAILKKNIMMDHFYGHFIGPLNLPFS
jgi:hypothetical protein